MKIKIRCKLNVSRIVAAISAIILTVACDSNAQHHPLAGAVSVSVSLRKDFKDSVDLVKYYDYRGLIKVDTTVMLGKIGGGKYCGDYFLLDASNHNIVRIDTTGRVLNTIGQRGRAHWEYIGIEAFDINPISKEVVVYDMMGDKVLLYSCEGVFIRSFPIDKEHDIYEDIAVLPEGNILCCQYGYQGPKGRRGIWMIDNNGHFLKQLVSIPDQYRFHITTGRHKFNRINDDVVGIAGYPGDDHIYHILSDGTVKAEYFIEFDETISDKTLETDFSEKVSMPDKYYYKNFYAENENMLYLSVFGSKQLSVIIVLDKETGEISKIRPGVYVIGVYPFVLDGSIDSQTFGICQMEDGRVVIRVMQSL